MYIIKMLKRKDAASIIVAIWVALSLNQLIVVPTFRLSNWISSIGDKNYNNMFGPGSSGWRNEYLNPLVSFIVQIVILEILIRLFVWVHPMFVRKRK